MSQVDWSELEADDDAWICTWVNGDTELHTTPAGDMLEHELDHSCACLPFTEDIGDGDILVMHNPWDGRPVT